MTCLRQGAGHAFAQVISYLHAAFEGRACRADRVLRHGGENGVVRLAFTCSKECHPEKLALWNSCCGLIIALGHGQPLSHASRRSVGTETRRLVGGSTRLTSRWRIVRRCVINWLRRRRSLITQRVRPAPPDSHCPRKVIILISACSQF